jgi:pimeloyl-ACP methyl ester carboxylesterase
MRRSIIGCLITLIALLASCSDDRNESKLSDYGFADAVHPVIVSFSGFNSCTTINGFTTPETTQRWNNSNALTKRHSKGNELWLRSCFDKWGNIHFISSLNPRITRTANKDNFQNMVDAILSLSGEGKNPVFMSGHSHGAWLAMQLALNLPDFVKIPALFTVDPISPNYCSPANYLLAILMPATAPGTLAGCVQAPPEFDNTARQAILNRLPDGAWRHYYQRNFLPLSSSAFSGTAQPHRSMDLSPFLSQFPAGARPSFNAHVGIDDLSSIWHSFGIAIQNYGQESWQGH